MAPILTIRPAIRPRERILNFGSGGTGKSNCALQIIRAIPDAHHYILDLDTTPTYERMFATEYTEVEARGNYTLAMFEPTEWAPLVPQLEKWCGVADADDWLHIDPITPTWDAVRTWYTDEVMGDDIADYLLNKRKEAKDNKDYNKSIKDDMNYDIINRQYFKLYAVLRRWPGHIYITAEQDGVREDDPKDIKGLFRGQKPKGQKKLVHVPATILHTVKTREGWEINTIKDRGRQILDEEDVEDFAIDYLVKIAGWKRAVVKSEG